MVVAAPSRRSPNPITSARSPKRGCTSAKAAQEHSLAPSDSQYYAWVERAERLAKLEPEFIFNPAFNQAGAEREILGPLGDRVGLTERRGESCSWKPSGGMSAAVARMCERKLLTPAEECMLFRRMNFAAYRTAVLRRKLDPTQPDPELIGRIERLHQLALDDRNEIVQANLRLVISIAKLFADPHNVFDDLLSEGVETLIRAAEKFDYDRGFRFSTYATQAVRRTLYRSVMNRQRDRQRFSTADGETFEDAAGEESPSTMTEARWHELRANLKRLLNRLEPREREIIRARFGLDRTGDVQTLQALAGDMGICKERVRQLEARAIGKLREMAAEVRLAPPDDA